MQIVGAVFLATVLLAGCLAYPTATPFPFTIERGPFEPTLNPANCSTALCCTDCPAIPVVRVITGDTFESAQRQRVRLFGIEAPEQGQTCFEEAQERLGELTGESVRVQFGPRQGDQDGSLLYYVYNDTGENIVEILAREGLALAWRLDGQHRDLLLAAEAGARRDQRGCLWVDDTAPPIRPIQGRSTATMP